jgi:protein-disulfide isomerase/uncharacterized membrane protein
MVLSLAGIGICAYLFVIHVSLLRGEIKPFALCGAETGLGCHAVTSGSHSSFMGVSLAAWGAVFFSTLFMLGAGSIIFHRDCGRAYLRWALILALAGFIFDAYLAYTMIFRIRTICWLCVSTYALNGILLILLAWYQWSKEAAFGRPFLEIFPGSEGRFKDGERYYRDVIKSMLLLGIVLAAFLVVGGARFLSGSLMENDRERLAKILENLDMQQPIVMHEEGRPGKGPANAPLQVVEFSDFLCPFCTMGAKYLKLTASDFQDSARFTFRHYPLDRSCNRRLSSSLHPGSCLLAEGAACADEQHKFWAYHDMAFGTRGKIDHLVVLKLAEDIGLDSGQFKQCLSSGRGRKVVLEDIEDAMRLGIRSTPTLIINGRVLRGVPKPWVLNEILHYAEAHFPIEPSGKK